MRFSAPAEAAPSGFAAGEAAACEPVLGDRPAGGKSDRCPLAEALSGLASVDDDLITVPVTGSLLGSCSVTGRYVVSLEMASHRENHANRMPIGASPTSNPLF